MPDEEDAAWDEDADWAAMMAALDKADACFVSVMPGSCTGACPRVSP